MDILVVAGNDCSYILPHCHWLGPWGVISLPARKQTHSRPKETAQTGSKLQDSKGSTNAVADWAPQTQAHDKRVIVAEVMATMAFAVQLNLSMMW